MPLKKQLAECIQSQVNISQDVLKVIIGKFEPLRLDPGDLLAEPGWSCKKMAFIADGVMRMYNVTDGMEVTIWIGSENRFITDLNSFIQQCPARWYIEAVTPSRLLIIDHEDHLSLLTNYTEWLEFDNRLLTSAYSILEQRIYSHLTMSAWERYDSLLNTDPMLFNRPPLKQIASLLGMTPETLSRLRKKRFS